MPPFFYKVKMAFKVVTEANFTKDNLTYKPKLASYGQN
jgi:hypothetical protein